MLFFWVTFVEAHEPCFFSLACIFRCLFYIYSFAWSFDLKRQDTIEQLKVKDPAQGHDSDWIWTHNLLKNKPNQKTPLHFVIVLGFHTQCLYQPNMWIIFIQFIQSCVSLGILKSEWIVQKCKRQYVIWHWLSDWTVKLPEMKSKSLNNVLCSEANCVKSVLQFIVPHLYSFALYKEKKSIM